MIDQQDLAVRDLEMMKQAGVDVPAWLLDDEDYKPEPGDSELLNKIADETGMPAWMTAPIEDPNKNASKQESIVTQPDLSPRQPKQAEYPFKKPGELSRVDIREQVKKIQDWLQTPGLSKAEVNRGMYFLNKFTEFLAAEVLKNEQTQ